MDNENIYTNIVDLEKEIEKRRNDKELNEKLLKFWHIHKPDFIRDNTCLVLSKPLITPNKELKYFLDIAKEFNFKTLFLEYLKGKFVGVNEEKRHLGKMYFYHGRGKKHGSKLNHVNIIDFTKQEGKRVEDVMTVNGKSVKDFHRQILKNKFPDNNFDIIDISPWFDNTKHLDEYYVFYLSLFIKDFVLFENFIFDDREESKFTKEKFMPSFEKVTKMFGYKPLIIPLLPHENEKSRTWFYYDGDIEEHVRGMI